MWTALIVVLVIGALGFAAWRYVKESGAQEVRTEVTEAQLDEEKKRRELLEDAAAEDSKKRLEEFNAKAAAVRDATGAAELLKSAAGRTAD